MASDWKHKLTVVLLILPLIPSVLVALWLMGVIGTSPMLEPGMTGGMNIFAAAGWGAGVYCMALIIIGMGLFAYQAVTR